MSRRSRQRYRSDRLAQATTVGEQVKAVLAQQQDDQTDPWTKIDGMPPNAGQPVLPHVVTFQGFVSAAAKVYRASDEALRDSYENARFMRNDPAIMECVEQRERSVSLLNWRIQPDDEKDQLQVEMCSRLKKLIEFIPAFMRYRLSLASAIWYGKYAVAHTWGARIIHGVRYQTVTKWRPVHGDKLAFRFDDGTTDYDPDSVGIRCGAALGASATSAKIWLDGHRDQILPTDWGLAYFLKPRERHMLAIHRHMIEDGEYDDPLSADRIHGVGIRSRIYWCWYQKQEALAWLMEYLERSAFGIEMWYYPWGNDEAKKQAEKAATERIGNGRNVVLVPRPPGAEGMSYGVERIEPGMAGAEVLKSILIEYYGHLIKRYILGQTLTTEAAGTGLGSNLASIHLDTFLQIIRHDAINLSETLTTDLVEPLKRINFPWASDIPVKFVIDTESPDVATKLEAWLKAWEMGCKLRERDVMDMIGAETPEEGEAVLRHQASEPNDDLADAFRKSALNQNAI